MRELLKWLGGICVLLSAGGFVVESIDHSNSGRTIEPLAIILMLVLLAVGALLLSATLKEPGEE